MSFRQFDDRVADDAGAPSPVLVVAVEDEHSTIDADLLRGQTRTIGGRVGGEHVRQQLLKTAAEIGYRSSWRVKYR